MRRAPDGGWQQNESNPRHEEFNLTVYVLRCVIREVEGDRRYCLACFMLHVRHMTGFLLCRHRQGDEARRSSA